MSALELGLIVMSGTGAVVLDRIGSTYMAGRAAKRAQSVAGAAEVESRLRELETDMVVTQELRDLLVAVLAGRDAATTKDGRPGHG